MSNIPSSKVLPLISILKISLNNFLLIISTVVISGCLQEESPTKSPTTTQLPKTEVTSDPIIQRAEPYISEIVFDDINLRKQAASIVSECPSGDKECQVNKLYRYIVENYNYYSDPRSGEFIQSPSETMNIKGGDCEDLTILLISLLENLGIKTYLVLTEDHAYCLACDMDTEDLWQYIEESIIIQVSEDLGQKENLNVVIENGLWDNIT